MADFTKAQKRQLRDLAGLAYERELSLALEDLEADFKSWRTGEINAFDLKESIHSFHQGPARELWGVYNNLKEDLLVARGVAHGLLKESEVTSELLSHLREAVKVFEDEML